MFVKFTKDYLTFKAGQQVEVSDGDGDNILKAGVAEKVDGNPIGEAINRHMAAMLDGMNRSVDAAINQALKQFAEAQAFAGNKRNAILFGKEGGDSKKSFGDWLLAAARKDSAYLEKHYGSKFNEWRRKRRWLRRPAPPAATRSLRSSTRD